jgi:hypothetical protein
VNSSPGGGYLEFVLQHCLNLSPYCRTLAEIPPLCCSRIQSHQHDETIFPCWRQLEQAGRHLSMSCHAVESYFAIMLASFFIQHTDRVGDSVRQVDETLPSMVTCVTVWWKSSTRCWDAAGVHHTAQVLAHLTLFHLCFATLLKAFTTLSYTGRHPITLLQHDTISSA